MSDPSGKGARWYIDRGRCVCVQNPLGMQAFISPHTSEPSIGKLVLPGPMDSVEALQERDRFHSYSSDG
ncbi:hypothetical protein M404DRAFT_1000596 [Pisolithus tinctorius Marx 270]|uniref:Uncharacterized protein n=1 Tax=Pisolithus tinctorius Marx 270 TaxID=870435 RepID=A0A0C3PA82_PISTI|nr:hypothetical protein M404DRAFT_1000596 [Pisolithus tinctorius Marx 270]